MSSADPLLSVILAAGIAAVMCAVLIISLVSVRKPTTPPMVVCSALIAAALIVVVVIPLSDVPVAAGIPLTALGIAAATIGGNPFTRRALDIATGNRVRETEDGGILIIASHDADPQNARTLMRGGTVIGYLERLAAVIAIAVGFPEAVAAVIAVKGIGRFPELAEPEARERFIIGTVASLLWAGVIGAIVRLSLG
ncbi:hypothetical protein [Microbacterium aerolatum]|uniref:Uncharacterized protein n=1 Tax=Microbacterium aerolatum TaxID=153731 RepID=A0A511AJ56_9MICO|nr:hypothetical protein [Microbacterium aerolatum]GEK87363.1 hypothetical protein MAE01_25390 [Microbacterium aerolatum]GGB13605.1 hypothetical protein GCM10007198_00060 [Microbacterium aerolatum]